MVFNFINRSNLYFAENISMLSCTENGHLISDRHGAANIYSATPTDFLKDKSSLHELNRLGSIVFAAPVGMV